MDAWYVKEVQRCYRCKYDIGQTLNDGFRKCPECGSEIAEEWERDLEFLPIHVRWLVYLSWLVPMLPLPAAALTEDLTTLWLLIPASMPVYFGWWWIERWHGGAGAWKRAIGTTLAVIILGFCTSLALLVLLVLLWRGF